MVAIQQLEKTLAKLNAQVIQQTKRLKQLQNQNSSLQIDIKNSDKQLNSSHEELKRLNEQLKQKENNIQKYYQVLKEQASQSFLHYEKNLDQYYEQTEKDFEIKMNKIKEQQQQAKKQLDQIKHIQQIINAALLRERQNKEQESFYQIKLTDNQNSDITKLQQWKKDLYDPSIISKVIWSTYVMKPTTDMCNRVLNSSSPVCGIYKITNKVTKQTYIGQSVNISDRWKQHIKCGLGIDASPTNKLYNNMQKTGVTSFTFEVLQKCSRDQLNEKEKYWIEFYESNKIGLNTQGGKK